MLDETRQILDETIIITAILILLFFTPLKVLAILIPIAYLFIESEKRKRKYTDIGFNIKGVAEGLRLYGWMLLVPIAVNIVTIIMIKAWSPYAFNQILQKVKVMTSLKAFGVLSLQLFMVSFSEEIVFRSFLQKRYSLFMKPKYAILLTCIIFIVLNLYSGMPNIILHNLFSVAINSIIYSYIFYKSNNVYISSISYFLTNIVTIYIIPFM